MSTHVKRVPTDRSYISVDTGFPDPSNPTGHSWVYAEDAERQIQNARAPDPTHRYPSTFQNYENLPVTPIGPLEHTPILASGQQWVRGMNPGAIRGVYNDNDRQTFDIIAHNGSAGQSGQGHGLFVMGTRHARAPQQPSQTHKPHKPHKPHEPPKTSKQTPSQNPRQQQDQTSYQGSDQNSSPVASLRWEGQTFFQYPEFYTPAYSHF
ncbi:hypothetical protein HYFRA_00013124 [Hymenoscyphus fraxineus]|uniref:Uncharacterized protein n=1 Tax=Hymenoscyphus fraxineus TaxID=746836 RepID=A0A9N9L984_9HELO|nr:hypothetical protein HYFRA_00013124 [Hymenoscyphus fraxineus]